MFCLHIRCHIRPEKIAEFRKISLLLMENTRMEPGCLSYDIGEEEPGVVAWIERWDTEEALEAHKTTRYYLDSEAAMNGFFLADADVQRLDPFTS